MAPNRLRRARALLRSTFPAIGIIRDGKLVPLDISSSARPDSFPTLATIMESGHPAKARDRKKVGAVFEKDVVGHLELVKTATPKQ